MLCCFVHDSKCQNNATVLSQSQLLNKIGFRWCCNAIPEVSTHWDLLQQETSACGCHEANAVAQSVESDTRYHYRLLEFCPALLTQTGISAITVVSRNSLFLSSSNGFNRWSVFPFRCVTSIDFSGTSDLDTKKVRTPLIPTNNSISTIVALIPISVRRAAPVWGPNFGQYLPESHSASHIDRAKIAKRKKSCVFKPGTVISSILSRKSSGRSEYWVSQKRKFCEYCKCSIADNKPSIQFHENGKKHKENVKIRLSEMQKKASKDAYDASKINSQMKQMEKAAMKAYLKDMESNPDFTSQMIKETLDSEAKPIGPQPEPPAAAGHSSATKKVKEKKWMEAKTAEDYKYYWHVETGESVWEAPKEGFLSIEEQKNPQRPPPPKVEKKTVKIKKEVKVSDLNKQIYGTGSNVSMKQSSADPATVMGPSPRQQPYGSWTAVVKEEVEEPDLQLPEANFQPVYVPTVSVPEEKPKVFKEKKAPVSRTATTSFGDGDVAFKKRKFGGGRNVRQRGGED